MGCEFFNESGDTSFEVLSGDTGFIPVQGGAEVDINKNYKRNYRK